MSKQNDDSAILQRFVETFTILDDSTYTHDNPPAVAFSAGIDPDDWDVIRWHPAPWKTPPEAIDAIRCAGPLPSLFETLVLEYRWPEVDLGLFRLLPNEPASDLKPLADAMFSDPVLNATLLPAYYVRFAMATDSYDPICFDLNKIVDGDCQIIRFEHESILMHDSIGEYSIVSATFRDLMIAVIDSTE